jgi:DNA mismatch repair protein MutL
MSDIIILPETLRNKIAAGEVVERPASVVKELVENSIDAGSTRIDIEILRSGKRLIRVSDNGIGMDREDALLAFKRYATSKIKKEEDLFNINTMGFRGEALSSISSVSKINLTTSKKGDIGTFVEIVGGEIKNVKDCSTTGTSVEVWDLFFNTPARRKFLKTDSTENYHIIDTVTKIALSHYRVGFFLRSNNQEIINLPPAVSYRERITQLFGIDFIDNLIEINKEDNLTELSITAFLKKPINTKNQKNKQFIFINNRPIKDTIVSSAVYKAYEEFISRNEHPVFFIFLKIDPRMVDFNVHPTKREVRFSKRDLIFNFVYSTVREALKKMNYNFEKTIEDNRSYFVSQPAKDILSVSEDVKPFNVYNYEYIPFLYIGDTFIAICENNGITIIDYHAAHERINYERLLKKIKKESDINLSQRFLISHQVRIQESEYRLILENLDLLKDLGIDIEDFGHNSLIIRGVPDFLAKSDLNLLINDICNFLLEESLTSPPSESTLKKLAAKIACHSSIRGKDIPDGYRIAKLIKDLNETDNPNSCPHGRPIRIYLSINELKKMFKK